MTTATSPQAALACDLCGRPCADAYAEYPAVGSAGYPKTGPKPPSMILCIPCDADGNPAKSRAAARQPRTLPRNDLRHALDGPLVPSAALSEAACDEVLRPLYVGGHLALSSPATEGLGNSLASLLLVRRGHKDTPLGTGSTLAAAKRQAAERVQMFGVQQILECW